MSAPVPDAGLPVAAVELDELFASFRGIGHVLIAVSGGPDSIALAGLAAQWVQAHDQERPRLSIASVDHGLRAEAADEVAAVATFARQLGLPHAALAWDGPKPAAGLQEAARHARYRLLTDHAWAIGAEALATAHTLDDQAETVLMRLSAGTGLSGLAAMRAVSRTRGLTHLRPLLGMAKARLVATCVARGWPFSRDPSNLDPRFTRSRLRALAPLLTAEGLTSERLALVARRAGRADEALEQAAQTALGAGTEVPGGWEWSAHMLQGVHFEVLIRAFARAVRHVAGPDATTPLSLERLERLAEEAAAALSAGQRMKRSLGGCVVTLGPRLTLRVTRETERRRGRIHPAAVSSLGKGGGGS